MSATKTLQHLWAVGYDDMESAYQVRDHVISLGWDTSYLILTDIAVVVRNTDGSFTLDREPLPVVGNMVWCTTVGFIAGLVVAAPLGGALVGALIGGAETALEA